MLCKIGMSQKRDCERKVGFGRGQVPIMECFVNDAQCSSAAWLLEVGCHTPDGVDLKVCVASTAELLGCFKGGKCVFCEGTKEGKGTVFGGCEEVRFPEGLLSSANSEETFVRGKAGVEVCSMLGELPAFCFQLEALRKERPIERWRPVRDVVVFLNPGLIVVVMGGELDWGEVMHIVVGMPVS